MRLQFIKYTIKWNMSSSSKILIPSLNRISPILFLSMFSYLVFISLYLACFRTTFTKPLPNQNGSILFYPKRNNEELSLSDLTKLRNFDPFSKNISNNDPTLLLYIKRSLRIPIPRGLKKYNLSHPNIENPTQMTDKMKYLLYYYCDNVTSNSSGFFIEVGANDGEYLSNTLYLERFKNWTGLLIEPNPRNMKPLKAKNRVAWIAECCLSSIPQKLHFFSKDEDTVLSVVSNSKQLTRNNKGYSRTGFVSCYPLYSLLLSINQTVIDFFSLDVEGYEMEVLKTIPFDKVFIKIILVEIGQVRKIPLKDLLIKNNYKLIFETWNDYLFVHNSLL